MRRARPFILAGIGLAALCGMSSAASASCSASTVGVNFGVYDSQSGVPDDSTGTVNISCSGEGFFLFPTVSLGTGSSGTYASRRMRNGANNLQYNLYTDSARATVWGNGSGGSSTQNVIIFFGSGSRTIYGRIPTGQSVNAGTYSDTLVVTVEY
ncbi:MAG TPA: spore coat U domain-containing protein [Sphingomicrobium sp.]|nr:spore coat U domain-containing protein [Sphingomicrobium sp.]